MDYTSRLIRSATYMDQLLGDLLEYSRLGQFELPLEPVYLETVVRDVLETLTGEIEAKAGEVEVRRPLAPVRAHLPTLKQILSNLLSNALKFVPAGTPPRVLVWTEERTGLDTGFDPGPRVEIRDSCEGVEIPGALPESDSPPVSLVREPRRVRLWIADNGIGIEPDQHEKIFGLFQRVHTTEAYPGTGIGLAIVRKGIERMGGQVGVESHGGQGSRFWLELPDAAGAAGEGRSKAA